MDTVTHFFHFLDAYLILLVIFGIVYAIYTDKLNPPAAFLAGTLFLIVFGSIEVESFLASFSNKQIITIFLLIFITVAIRQNVDVNRLFYRVFRQEDSPKIFRFKMIIVVSMISSFINNTPIVSMLTNNIQDWARRKQASPSKFLIPLSYAAMLGGMITVIGTSTNLVLQGLLSASEEPLLNHADFFAVGTIVCIMGVLFLGLFGGRLLPDRKIAIKHFADNIGEYIHEVELEVDNSLVGRTIQDAGMKNLQGIYLIEIARNGEVITPVAPDELIERGDHFYFAGDTERVVEFVQNLKGLKLPSEEKLEKVGQGNIVEVVIPTNSKLAGTVVKESNFRQQYNASIIGIHRNGEKISGKIGYVKLKSGDLLLLLTGKEFSTHIHQDRDLFLVSHIRKISEPKPVKSSVSHVFLHCLNLALLIAGYINFFTALLLGIFLLILFKRININDLKKSFDLDLMVVLGCSLTLGREFIESGASELLSSEFLNLSGSGNLRIVLSALFIFTAILTSFITNVASVSIAFPLAYSLSSQMGIPGAPFYLTIAFAASAAFLTPMGYQTNMMIYGPGGYKSIDFLKIGLPMLMVYMLTSLFTIFWWFEIA